MLAEKPQLAAEIIQRNPQFIFAINDVYEFVGALPPSRRTREEMMSARWFPAARQGMGPTMETALARQPRVSPAPLAAGRASLATPDRHG
jgi:hypothetical protein